MEGKSNCIRSIMTDYILDVHIPNILLGIGASIEIPMVTLLGRRLRASQSRIAMFVLISSLCRSALDIPFGIITEYVGVRNVMLASLLLNALAALIGWRIHSVMSLVVYCVLSGTSLGAFFLSRHIFVASISSRRHRGIVMAFLSGLLRWAHVLGPTAIGLITSWTNDVRDAFVFAFCTSLAAFVSIIVAPIVRSATHSIPALSLTTSPHAHDVDLDEDNENKNKNKNKKNELNTKSSNGLKDKEIHKSIKSSNENNCENGSSGSVRSINSTQSFNSAIGNNANSPDTNRESRGGGGEEHINKKENWMHRMESDVPDVDFGINSSNSENNKHEKTKDYGSNSGDNSSHTVDILESNENNTESNASASFYSEPVINNNKNKNSNNEKRKHHHHNYNYNHNHKSEKNTRMLAQSLPPMQMHRGHVWSSLERQPRQVVSVHNHELEINKVNSQEHNNNNHRNNREIEESNMKGEQENTKWQRRRRYNMSPHPLEPDNFYTEHHPSINGNSNNNNNNNNKFNNLRVNTNLSENMNDSDDETPHYHIHISSFDNRLHPNENGKEKNNKRKKQLHKDSKNINEFEEVEEEEELEELKRAYTTSSIPFTPSFSLTTLAPGLATQSTDDLSLHALFITLRETWHIIWRLGMAVVFFSAVRANRKLMMAFASMRAEMSDVQLSYVLSFGFCFDALLFPLGGIVMQVMGRYHALIPVCVGFGIIFTLLPWCTTWKTVYLASALFGIADSLSCGVVMTLTADYAPKVYGAPFFGIIRTLEDLGHVLGAGGSSLLLRVVGFDMTSWGLALQSGLTIVWVLFLLPCYNCNIDTPVPEPQTDLNMRFDKYNNNYINERSNVNRTGIKKRFFTPDVQTSSTTPLEPSLNITITPSSSSSSSSGVTKQLSESEPLLSQDHKERISNIQEMSNVSSNNSKGYGATEARENQLLLPLPFTKKSVSHYKT